MIQIEAGVGAAFGSAELLAPLSAGDDIPQKGIMSKVAC